MKARIVCVLGMHRSGTSLTAQVLHRLGVHLGNPLNIAGPHPANASGFWENIRLKDINEAILALRGGTWFAPRRLRGRWRRDGRLAPLEERARRVLEEEFGRSRRWGWKDPRNCITLPFWQRLLPPMRYVLCVRHPVSVARSLAARDGLSPLRSLRLWWLYNAAALRHAEQRRLLVVHYEGYFRDPDAVVEALARFIGVRPPEAGAAMARQAIDPSLCHHAVEGDAGAGVLLPGRVSLLYRSLKRTWPAGRRRRTGRRLLVRGEGEGPWRPAR